MHVTVAIRETCVCKQVTMSKQIMDLDLDIMERVGCKDERVS